MRNLFTYTLYSFANHKAYNVVALTSEYCSHCKYYDPIVRVIALPWFYSWYYAISIFVKNMLDFIVLVCSKYSANFDCHMRKNIVFLYMHWRGYGNINNLGKNYGKRHKVNYLMQDDDEQNWGKNLDHVVYLEWLRVILLQLYISRITFAISLGKSFIKVDVFSRILQKIAAEIFYMEMYKA